MRRLIGPVSGFAAPSGYSASTLASAIQRDSSILVEEQIVYDCDASEQTGFSMTSWSGPRIAAVTTGSKASTSGRCCRMR